MTEISRMGRWPVVVLILWLSAGVVACSSEDPDVDNQNQAPNNGENHSSNNGVDPPLDWGYPDPYAEGDEVDWVVETDAIYARLPAVDGQGGLVFGDWDGLLRRVDPDTGDVDWTYQADGRIDAAPAIDDQGQIIVGDWSGTVHAVDAEGQEQWRYDASAIVDTSPTVDGEGRIWVADNDGVIHIISAQGELEQSYALGASATTAVSMVVDEGDWTAFVGTQDDRLHCIDDTGLFGQAELAGHARFDLAINDDNYAIATMDNGVAAAIDTNCDVVWEENATYATLMPAVIHDDGRAWIWAHNRNFYVFNGESGAIEDQFDHLIRSNTTTTPSLADDGRVLISIQGVVGYRGDGESGILSDIDAMDAPVLVDGAAFVTTERAALVRLAGEWPELGTSSWPTQHANLQRTGRIQR